MKKREVCAYGLIIFIGIAMLTAFFEASMSYEAADGLYSLAGFGFLIFGVWSSVLLLNNK